MELASNTDVISFHYKKVILAEDFDMRDRHQVMIYSSFSQQPLLFSDCCENVADRWGRVTSMSKAEEDQRKLKARYRVFPCLCFGAFFLLSGQKEYQRGRSSDVYLYA